MLLFIIAFFFDCISAALFAQWMTSTLLFCFIAQQFMQALTDYTVKNFYFPCFMLLIQDFLLYGRFGFALLWLTLLCGIIWGARKVMLHGYFVLPFLLVAGCIIFDAFVVKFLVGSQQPFFLVTICKICYTWVSGIIIFLGLRGNRCLSILYR